MNSARLRRMIFLFLLLLPFAYAAYLYPNAPERVPIHFNLNGEPDGWGNRSSLFIGPLILGIVGIFVYVLVSNLHRIDPKRYGDSDDRVFQQIALLTQTFLCCLNLLTLYSSMHQEAPLQKLLFAFIGLMFSIFGIYMSKLKQNYFTGFKLPWTLASEPNWVSTHQLAGKLWFVGGLLLLPASIFLEGAPLSILFFLIIAIICIWPCVHSYLFFRKEQKEI
ncbi:MAG: SdpI family protein [Bacteroidota bacterium]